MGAAFFGDLDIVFFRFLGGPLLSQLWNFSMNFYRGLYAIYTRLVGRDNFGPDDQNVLGDDGENRENQEENQEDNQERNQERNQARYQARYQEENEEGQQYISNAFPI